MHGGAPPATHNAPQARPLHCPWMLGFQPPPHRSVTPSSLSYQQFLGSPAQPQPGMTPLLHAGHWRYRDGSGQGLQNTEQATKISNFRAHRKGVALGRVMWILPPTQPAPWTGSPHGSHPSQSQALPGLRRPQSSCWGTEMGEGEPTIALEDNLHSTYPITVEYSQHV